MSWLNYHHLLYFWTVAREGSITRACEQLRLTQPTISGQLRELERNLGVKLFDRVGRNLVLSEAGQEVFRYADEIFSVGKELEEALKGRVFGRPLRLVVGIAESVPKLLCFQFLEPVLQLPELMHMVCDEGPLDRLLARLALHELDIVLADAPPSPRVKVKTFQHLLGECGVSLCGTSKLAAACRGEFPACLDGTPFLLPSAECPLRTALDRWFDQAGIRPVIRGEFADSSLLKTFGQAGVGVFAVPSVIEAEVCRQYGVRVLGRLDTVRERYYAISVERKLRHPAVAAVVEFVRREIFA